LMVVILIIAMLMSIIVPAGQTVVAMSRRTRCAANLKNLGTALAAYHVAKDHYPVGNTPSTYWTFQSRLLPFLDHKDLVDHMDLSANCFRDTRMKEGKKSVPAIPLTVMLCPSDSLKGEVWRDEYWGSYAPGNYFGVIGTTARKKDGMLFSKKFPVRDSDVTDGDANTIFVGERGNVSNLLYGWWACCSGDHSDGDGDNLLTTERGLAVGGSDPENRWHFWSEHVAGGGNFLYVSGNVKWHTYDIDYRLLQSLATRAGKDNGDAALSEFFDARNR